MIRIVSIATIALCVNADFQPKQLQFGKGKPLSIGHVTLKLNKEYPTDFASFTSKGYKGYSQKFHKNIEPTLKSFQTSHVKNPNEDLNLGDHSQKLEKSEEPYSRTWNYQKQIPHGFQVGQKSVYVKPYDGKSFHGFSASYSDRSVQFGNGGKQNALKVQLSKANIPILSGNTVNVHPKPMAAEVSQTRAPQPKNLDDGYFQVDIPPSSTKASDFKTDVGVQTEPQDIDIHQQTQQPEGLAQTTQSNDMTPSDGFGLHNVNSDTTTVSQTSAPKVTVPETTPTAIEPVVPEISAPETSAPETNIPETNPPQTNLPEIKAPEINQPTINAALTNAGEAEERTPETTHQAEASQSTTQTVEDRSKTAQENAKRPGKVTVVYTRVKTVLFGHDFNRRKNLIIFGAVVSMLTVAMYSLILLCCATTKPSQIEQNQSNGTVEHSRDSTHTVDI